MNSYHWLTKWVNESIILWAYHSLAMQKIQERYSNNFLLKKKLYLYTIKGTGRPLKCIKNWPPGANVHVPPLNTVLESMSVTLMEHGTSVSHCPCSWIIYLRTLKYDSKILIRYTISGSFRKTRFYVIAWGCIKGISNLEFLIVRV